DLFPGTTIIGWWPFRVTRNSELYIDEGDLGSLLEVVEIKLRNRRRGQAVRLEIDHECPEAVRTPVMRTLGLTKDDVYLVHGPLHPRGLMTLSQGDHPPEL